MYALNGGWDPRLRSVILIWNSRSDLPEELGRVEDLVRWSNMVTKKSKRGQGTITTLGLGRRRK